jgi:hypothetical protein
MFDSVFSVQRSEIKLFQKDGRQTFRVFHGVSIFFQTTTSKHPLQKSQKAVESTIFPAPRSQRARLARCARNGKNLEILGDSSGRRDVLIPPPVHQGFPVMSSWFNHWDVLYTGNHGFFLKTITFIN